MKSEEYKEKLVELMNQAKLDNVEIVPYSIKIEGYDNPVETGICIQEGEHRIKIPTYKIWNNKNVTWRNYMIRMKDETEKAYPR